MSELDSMLAQLKNSLSSTQQETSVATLDPAESAKEAQTASMALKDFLSKACAKTVSVEENNTEDPQIIISRRKALSAFVGSPLTNNGEALLSGVIHAGPNSSKHGKQGSHGHSAHAWHGHSAQGHSVQSSAAHGHGASPQVAAPASGAHTQTVTVCSRCSSQAESNKPQASTAPESAKQEPAKAAGKAPVAAFFAALTQATPQNAAKAGSATAPQNAASVAWFKHIQAVESAIRIGDIHFADTLLLLLFEVSRSLSAEANVSARLQSLQARVLLDRKQYADVETLMNETIKSLDGTAFAKSVSASYCWHALAQCYHSQKKFDKADAAKKKAISIAESALGPNDPETMLFKGPLAN